MTIRKFLNYWIGKKRSGFYLFLGFLSAAAFLWGSMLQNPESRPLSLLLKRAGLLSFLGIILAFFIHMNLHAVHWFLEHYKDTDRLPKKQIFLVNSFCMTAFISLNLIALPAAAFFLEPLWQMIGRWFSNRTSLDRAVYPALYMQSEPIIAPELPAFLADPPPTAVWISLLDKIVRCAGTLIILCLMVLALCRLLLCIWAWITKHRNFDNDEKIYLTPTWTLSSVPNLLPRKKRKGFQLSYDEKIRQKYRREILSLSARKKQSPAPSASPAELEEAAGLRNPALHRLYEKARYSQNGCTKADWETLSYLRSRNLCTDSDSSLD